MSAPTLDSRHLSLGTKIANMGKIGAVGIIEGERYYWLVGLGGVVSMMPACVVEALAHPID